MEISQIRTAMPFLFPGSEKEAPASTIRNSGDTVDLHGVEILADEDVEGIFNETISMIGSDSAAALSVHSGLSESRVFALLGM